MRKLTTRSWVIFFSIALPLLTISAPYRSASAVSPSNWQAGRIIDDSLFTDYSSMSVGQIQAFLNGVNPSCDTNGTQPASEYGRSDLTHAQYAATRGWPSPPYVCLKNFYEVPKTAPGPGVPANNYSGSIPAGAISAAQMIYNAAQQYRISPKVLLVTIHKESAGPLTTDDWPLERQYTYAMGAHCPDSGPGGSANCDPNYAGFSIQIAESAALFRWYLDNLSQPWWPYKKIGNNSILYNPNADCGSSTVNIVTSATAALYTYTPYQPNPAALAAGYGTAPCGAYGNRNFWLYYNDWFGSTNGGIILGKYAGSPTVYALYGGKKQGIPSEDVLKAWGLDALPVNVLPDISLDSMSTLPALTRLAKNPYSNGLYLFADKGGTYDSLANMAQNWGYNPANASQIGEELVAATRRLGGLSAYVTAPNAGAIFAVDSGTRRAFSTPENFQSWAQGTPVNEISTDLLSQLTLGDGMLSNQARSGSKDYIATSGRLLDLSEAATLYPRNAVMTISGSFADVLPKGTASRFIKGSGGAIYLVDNGSKHGIASLSLLNSYAPTGTISVTVLSDAELNQIPNGQTVNTRFAYDPSDPSKQYYINNSTYALPAGFAAQSWGFGISTKGLQLVGPTNVPISCSQGLVQAAGSPGISIMDSGVKRGIASLDMLSMIKQSAGNVCVLNPEDVNAIPTGTAISPFVSNSGVNYMIEQNSRFTVSPTVASSIGVSSFTPVSNTFISGYTDGGVLASQTKIGNSYVLTESGKYFSTANSSVAALWGIPSNAQSHSPQFVKFIANGGDLIPFARPTDPTVGAIYIVDGGKFLPIASLDHLFNAGFAMQTIPAVSLGYINANLGSTWQGYLAKDASSNQIYVLEGGKKHAVPANLQANWLGATSPITPTTLTATYLNLLATGSQATKALETGQPGIYGINDGKKAGIPNLKTFNESYAPALLVSNQLVNSIPWGNPIPSN